MSKLRIVVEGEQMGPRFERRAVRFRKRVLQSMRDAAEEIADGVEQEGRQDISSGGNFGNSWTSAWKATVTEGGGFFRISVTMGGPPPVAYWRVFEEGRTIRGKPMLWIPLSFASDAKGVSARDYAGPLFKVERLGKAPLLLTTGGVPKYFGKESVRIPKKFHLMDIARKWARRAGKIYNSAYGRNKGG